MSRTIVYILLAAVALCSVACIRLVKDGEIWLVGEGADVRELKPGVHLLAPFASARKYRLVEERLLVGPDRLFLPLAAGRRLGLDAKVRFRVEPGQVRALDREYSGQLFEKLVLPLLVRDLAGSLSGDEAGPAVSARGPEIAGRLNRQIGTLGVEIVSISLSNLETESLLPKDLVRKGGVKVFILGLDAFDWQVAEAVSGEHRLESFGRLRADGSWGNLRSIEPLVSPLIWTTMVTGATPDVHGITDFLATDPETGEEIPATSSMRRVPALWNITSLFGIRSGFVGWLASYPAERVEGFVVSDRLAYHMFDPAWQGGAEVASGEGITYPGGILEEIRPLLVEPGDVVQDLSRYVAGAPGALKAEFDPKDPVSNLRLVISGYKTYEAVMKRLYPSERPGLFGIYFEFTDSVCHLFMKYMKPPMQGIDRRDADRFGSGVAGAYLEADRILGEVLSMVDDSTVVMMVSDHGFKSGDTRPLSDSRIGHGQAISWHRINGSIAMHGSIVKRGQALADASVLDVAPTVLYLLGLPVGSEMKGRVLVEALDDAYVRANPPRFTAQYDSLLVPAPARAVASSADRALKEKLVSLGYLAGGNASLVNMANYYHANGQYKEAIEVWSELIERDPRDPGARIGLSNARFKIGQTDEAIAGLEAVLREDASNLEALRSLATIYVELSRGSEALETAEKALRLNPDDGHSHFNRGLALELLGRADDAAREYREAVRLAPDLAEPYGNLAQILVEQGAPSEALDMAERAVGLAPTRPEMHYLLGLALGALGRDDDALKAYHSAIRLNEGFVPAYLGACGLLLARGEADSVLALCARALAASSQYAEYLHNMAGTAHLGGGRLREARREFEAALRSRAGFTPARMGLARVLIQEGRPRDARREVEAVLSAEPGNAEAQALLRNLPR